MARGQDSGRHPGRQVGPGSSLGMQIKAETASQTFLFGGTVGTQDSGERTLARPAPMNQVTGQKGAFWGAPNDAIKLAQMQENRRSAMPGLMQPPPSNDRPAAKLNDLGMGRLSDGVERPVKSFVDERLKRRDH